MRTLETARKEREELVQQLARLDKVIAVLTGQSEVVAAPRKRRGHKMSPEARQKMKDAWKQRKQRTGANGSEAVSNVASN